MRNELSWKTTSTPDTRMLYLTMMRDIKAYCKRGFCEPEVLICNFVEFPRSYMKRMLRVMPEMTDYRLCELYLFSWQDKEAIRRMFIDVIRAVTFINHATFSKAAFDAAFDEFSQYIR